MAGGIARALKVITSSAFDRRARDGDTVDRLNYMVMHGLLVFLAIFTATKQYVGTPIYCWLPAQYIEKYQRKFANNYCWVQTMYNVPFQDSIPVLEEKRYFNDVGFYRWGTMIFILLAALFQIPHLLWNELKKLSGANIDKLVGMTIKTTLMDQDKRDEQLSYVAEFVHRWVTTRNIPDRKGRFALLQQAVAKVVVCYGKRSGHNLVFIYLFIKFLYLLNAIAQFFIISAFLKTNYFTFGINALTSYAETGQWEDEYVFPRVALCDMKVHALANIHIYTIQCTLGMNLFLEKFYFILWFCFIFITIANAASFARWTFQLLQEAKTVKFLTDYSGQLFLKRSVSNKDQKMLLSMARNYLRADGVFLIRMIAENTTDLLTIDLIRQIWLRYRTFHSAELQKITGEFQKITGEFQKMTTEFQKNSGDSKEVTEELQKINPEEIQMNGGVVLHLDDVDH